MGLSMRKGSEREWGGVGLVGEMGSTGGGFTAVGGKKPQATERGEETLN